jgi:hypothetical protein
VNEDTRSLAERNRELLAERLGWPAGTIEACRSIEARCPGYAAWWSEGDMSTPEGAPYAARVKGARSADRTYYGRDADDVVAQIEADRSAR